ncbi:MAG: hypothetical protein LBK26_02295 [Rickettsiales bacterium]|jgi:hypothetical protein|nr:hypothetical protein [Rickettsiales bacterium]
MNKHDAERRLAELLMDDMPVIEMPVRPRAVAGDWFVKTRAARHAFLKSLSDSIQELSFLNLPQDAFMGLIQGRSCPENLSIRWRRPMEYGGEISEKNMFLTPRFPYAQNMDRFLMEQSGKATIWIPGPEKKVYVPTRMLGGGDGGNATTDRLSELAAQLAAERGMV